MVERHPAGRRYKLLRVSYFALENLFSLSGAFEFKASGLPDDARLACVAHDPYRQAALFTVHSDTFPLVVEGTEPETFTLQIQAHPLTSPS